MNNAAHSRWPLNNSRLDMRCRCTYCSCWLWVWTAASEWTAGLRSSPPAAGPAPSPCSLLLVSEADLFETLTPPLHAEHRRHGPASGEASHFLCVALSSQPCNSLRHKPEEKKTPPCDVSSKSGRDGKLFCHLISCSDVSAFQSPFGEKYYFQGQPRGLEVCWATVDVTGGGGLVWSASRAWEGKEMRKTDQIICVSAPD